MIIFKQSRFSVRPPHAQPRNASIDNVNAACSVNIISTEKAKQRLANNKNIISTEKAKQRLANNKK